MSSDRAPLAARDVMSAHARDTKLLSFLSTQAAAIAFSYAHTILDWFVGLFGMDRTVLSQTAAALLGLNALLYAAWAIAIALALRGDRAWMAATFVLTFGWAVLVSGGSILFCLPRAPPSRPTGTSCTSAASSSGDGHPYWLGERCAPATHRSRADPRPSRASLRAIGPGPTSKHRSRRIRARGQPRGTHSRSDRPLAEGTPRRRS